MSFLSRLKQMFKGKQVPVVTPVVEPEKVEVVEPAPKHGYTSSLVVANSTEAGVVVPGAVAVTPSKPPKKATQLEKAIRRARKPKGPVQVETPVKKNRKKKSP